MGFFQREQAPGVAHDIGIGQAIVVRGLAQPVRRRRAGLALVQLAPRAHPAVLIAYASVGDVKGVDHAVAA
jgi:hypothetical protein